MEEAAKVRKKKTKTVRYYDVDAGPNKDDDKTGSDIKVFDLSNLTQEKPNEKKSRKSKRRDYKSITDKVKKQKSNKMKKKAEVYDLTQIDFREEKLNSKRIDKKEKLKQFREEADPFPGDAPIDKSKIKKYRRAEKMDMDSIKTGYHKAKFKAKEKKYRQATKQAARTELLLHEEAGFLEADEGELTCEISQHDIKKAVDISSAQKFFELKLDKFGPYRMNYTRNGRQLLIGGGKGHVAALDWQTKKLMCEINVMETIQDIQWLHVETMFAVAQKQWTYIYDNQGVELHCLKALDRVLRLEFLPYHFLLVSANSTGYLTWLDISVGQKVAGFSTNHGRLDVMCQNPSNAIIHLGHAGGTVSLWSPNVKEPLVKMLCHAGGTRSIAVHHNGQYMATSGIDRTLKIWDLRMFKALHSTKIGVGASSLSFSQRGLLAAGIGNIVEVYRDPCRQAITAPYMSHSVKESVQNVQFCPFEDVLGVGHSAGFSSLLIPGSGEPNFDALESNPFQSKKQRQQAEVKMLLEKIQPEMINLDTSALGQVDTKTLQESMAEREKLLYLKPEKIDFEPKYKKKGRSKTGKIEQRKKGVKFEHKRDQIREFVRQKREGATEKTEAKNKQSEKYNVFERFKRTDV